MASIATAMTGDGQVQPETSVCRGEEVSLCLGHRRFHLPVHYLHHVYRRTVAGQPAFPACRHLFPHLPPYHPTGHRVFFPASHVFPACRHVFSSPVDSISLKLPGKINPPSLKPLLSGYFTTEISHQYRVSGSPGWPQRVTLNF